MPCEDLTHDHHWPETGELDIQPCERTCAYCEQAENNSITSYNDASVLRKHVKKVHVDKDKQGLVVLRGDRGKRSEQASSSHAHRDETSHGTETSDTIETTVKRPTRRRALSSTDDSDYEPDVRQLRPSTTVDYAKIVRDLRPNEQGGCGNNSARQDVQPKQTALTAVESDCTDEEDLMEELEAINAEREAIDVQRRAIEVRRKLRKLRKAKAKAKGKDL